MADSGGESRDGERRQQWERRWEQRDGPDFDWHRDTMPSQLVELIGSTTFPPGAALDLGCGDGVLVRQLVEMFPTAVGVDIAFGAVARGQQAGDDAHPAPSFAVMDAGRPAFRSEAFAFILDRGCLQNLPQGAWPVYFREVERMLLPGGLLQLFCCKAAKDFPSLLSKKGVLARAAWARGRQGGPQFASQDYIRQLLPPTLTPLAQADIPTRLKSGNLRTEIYGLFEKSP